MVTSGAKRECQKLQFLSKAVLAFIDSLEYFILFYFKTSLSVNASVGPGRLRMLCSILVVLLNRALGCFSCDLLDPFSQYVSLPYFCHNLCMQLTNYQVAHHYMPTSSTSITIQRLMLFCFPSFSVFIYPR